MALLEPKGKSNREHKHDLRRKAILCLLDQFVVAWMDVKWLSGQELRGEGWIGLVRKQSQMGRIAPRFWWDGGGLSYAEQTQFASANIDDNYLLVKRLGENVFGVDDRKQTQFSGRTQYRSTGRSYRQRPLPEDASRTQRRSVSSGSPFFATLRLPRRARTRIDKILIGTHTTGFLCRGSDTTRARMAGGLCQHCGISVRSKEGGLRRLG